MKKYYIYNSYVFYECKEVSVACIGFHDENSLNIIRSALDKHSGIISTKEEIELIKKDKKLNILSKGKVIYMLKEGAVFYYSGMLLHVNKIDTVNKTGQYTVVDDEYSDQFVGRSVNTDYITISKWFQVGLFLGNIKELNNNSYKREYVTAEVIKHKCYCDRFQVVHFGCVCNGI